MRSPYRLRAGPAEVWERLLAGELIRVVDRPLQVRGEQSFRLPGSGRWEAGLARIRPAFDDMLGDTALAVAWRWACAERGCNAWPGWPLLAAKATDQPVEVVEELPAWAMSPDGALRIDDQPASAGAALRWRLELPEGPVTVVLSGDRQQLRSIDTDRVDRVADMTAAWFDVPWRRDDR